MNKKGADTSVVVFIVLLLVLIFIFLYYTIIKGILNGIFG